MTPHRKHRRLPISNLFIIGTFVFPLLLQRPASADQQLLNAHCAKCHGGKKPKGDFDLKALGTSPTEKNAELWEASLDYVRAKEMPPAKKSRLSQSEREKIITFLDQNLRQYSKESAKSNRTKPRRLNNREFENSIRDVLLIEDIGTHLPTDNLIGDTLHEGFDTHGDSLGFSKFHLEQYIVAIRKIIDATIVSGKRPQSQRREFSSKDILAAHTSQNTTRPERRGTRTSFDFLDPKQLAYLEGLKTVQSTGWYKISIRCTGKDRNIYDAVDTGIYRGDPIQLSVRLGDRERTFDLPDETEKEITLTEWVAADSMLRLRYPTDGLRIKGNGNFKFQNAIAGQHLQKNNPLLYKKVVDAIRPTKSGRVLGPGSWHHWVNYWQGARPRVFGAVVEGPFYKSWPPERQVALIGKHPKTANAEAILKPIAKRAWRREIQPGELDKIVRLVQSSASELGEIESIKEGIVAVLASPQFLFLNRSDLTPEERFASKLSYFLQSTMPSERLLRATADGNLDSFAEVRAEVERQFKNEQAKPFLRAFPFAWLKLNDINFMAPDPDRYRLYHRKAISEDMVEEALRFFDNAIQQNIALPEFISADYSFINADLAQIYGAKDVPEDSKFRKHIFADGRRGGLLGMSAFLTVTADSLGTSPIHRAIYVMENFLGLHPDPPPADVVIEEPDVRSAKTIKEVLEAHRSDATCASCHQAIDPYGYAFENFDPVGAWRDQYVAVSDDASKEQQKKRSRRTDEGIPIDASASFRSGDVYKDIVEFRQLMQTDVNRDRFVRCFIVKLLTYANGEEPHDYAEIENILAHSGANGYQIVDTIAAVIDSPLFRQE